MTYHNVPEYTNPSRNLYGTLKGTLKGTLQGTLKGTLQGTLKGSLNPTLRETPKDEDRPLRFSTCTGTAFTASGRSGPSLLWFCFSTAC